MSSDPSSSAPANDSNLSGLGRALLDTGGSKPSGPWVPPTAEELHQILPQYEIVKMLGRGGMGAVYMGRQTSLERPVAIKILSAQLEESDRGFTERFKNEAKAMAKLNHPGIVSVYDFGTTSGGLLYIVMEFVDGTDVAKMIAKSGRLHTEHAMAITAHICDALAYAHERGIIHRDIKPANIMVGYDGAVKVADFGLAKVNAGGQTLGLTQSGMAMGTMHYMAPEALMLGTSVDHRADIYAVGVMLYQMLTGKLPQGMFKLPSLLVPGLDPRYDAIVRKALMEDRESRYQGIRELRAELDSILTQPVMKVAAPTPSTSVASTALPTGARPQRLGGRPPAHPASTNAQTISHERQRGSSAWLWVTMAVLLVLGGVGWFMFATLKQQAAAIPQPPASSAPPAPAIIEKTAVTTPPAAATPIPLPPGWISLFNGKDLSGWELHPSNFPADVQDGAIRIRGSSTIPVSGNMYYRGSGTALPQWTDFELICTVKTENKGNSGIFLHSSPGTPDKNRANGIEVQIWNDLSTGSTGKSGSLQRVAVTGTARFGDGEWFQVKTRVEGKRIQTWLKKPSETDWQSAVDWTQPANWTPPSDRPGIKLGSGTVSLQNNPPIDGVVWFKDIQFRELNSAPAPLIASPSSSMPGSAVQIDEAFLQKNIRGTTWRTRYTNNYYEDSLVFAAGGQAVEKSPATPYHQSATWRFGPDGNTLEVVMNVSPALVMRLRFTSDSSAQVEFQRGGRADALIGTITKEGAHAASAPAITTLVETFGGHRYQFVPGSFTWQEAKAKAEGMDGHLATVTSKEENDWLLLTYKNLLPAVNRNIWLGAIESAPGAGWKWVTGEPFAFTGWVVNEPNGVKGGGGQVGPPFMLNLYSFRETVGWNDSSTHESQSRNNIGFIVEWDSLAAPTTSTPVASATLWIDTKSRTLQAKFVRLQGANVLLDVAGKVTPVALASLSAASQQQARDLQAALPAAPAATPPPTPSAPTSKAAPHELVLNLSLEGGANDDVTVSLGSGSSRTVLARVKPGRRLIDCSKVGNGQHYLKFSGQGYAAQSQKMEFENGRPLGASLDVNLFRNRFVTVRVAINTSGGRELTGPNVKEERIALTHMTAPTLLRAWDWRIWQFSKSGETNYQPGTIPWISMNNCQSGFGLIKAAEGETFDTMTTAPQTGYVTNFGRTGANSAEATKGVLYYIRNHGGGSTSAVQSYGKLFIEDVTDTPPAGVPVKLPPD